MKTLPHSLKILAAALTITLFAAPRIGVPQTPANSPDYPFKVGDTAPEFELKDQNGKTRTLKQALSDSNVALVFFRSADW